MFLNLKRDPYGILLAGQSQRAELDLITGYKWLLQINGLIFWKQQEIMIGIWGILCIHSQTEDMQNPVSPMQKVTTRSNFTATIFSNYSPSKYSSSIYSSSHLKPLFTVTFNSINITREAQIELQGDSSSIWRTLGVLWIRKRQKILQDFLHCSSAFDFLFWSVYSNAWEK